MIRILALLGALLLPVTANAQSQAIEAYVGAAPGGASATPLASTVKCAVFPSSSASTLAYVPCYNFMGKQPGTYTAGDALISGSGAMSSTDATDAGGAPGLTNAMNGWSQDQKTPVCTIAPGATVTPTGPSCKLWTITLNQNTKIYFPASAPCGTAANWTCQKAFQINQPIAGSSSYGVTFDAGSGNWYFPSAGAQPVLTNATNVSDFISCQGVSGSPGKLYCSNNGLNNFEPASVVTLDSNYNVGYTGNGSTTVTVSPTSNSIAGRLRILIPFACVNSSCTPQAATAATISASDSENCPQAQNAYFPGSPNNGVQGGIFYCSNIPGGTRPTFTANFSSGQMFYPGMFDIEFAPATWMTQSDAQLGNTSSSGNASNGSIGTQLATTLNGELTVAWCNGGGTPVFAAPATTIISDSSTHNVVAYFLAPVVSVQTLNFTQTAAAYGCAIAAFK